MLGRIPVKKYLPEIYGVMAFVLIAAIVLGWPGYKAYRDGLTASPARIAAAMRRVSAMPKSVRAAAVEKLRDCLKTKIEKNGAATHVQVRRCLQRAMRTAVGREQELAAGLGNS